MGVATGLGKGRVAWLLGWVGLSWAGLGSWYWYWDGLGRGLLGSWLLTVWGSLCGRGYAWGRRGGGGWDGWWGGRGRRATLFIVDEMKEREREGDCFRGLFVDGCVIDFSHLMLARGGNQCGLRGFAFFLDGWMDGLDRWIKRNIYFRYHYGEYLCLEIAPPFRACLLIIKFYSTLPEARSFIRKSSTGHNICHCACLQLIED